jgi:feruloyl esterase
VELETLTYAQFNRLFAQSVNEFSSVIATDNPDLSAFKKDGGKILLWHGLADELILPQGTINYYQRVQQAMGGAAATDTFARLFLAPGAQHCASAAGPAPADPLAAVATWVTKGQAPTSILATVTDATTGVVTLSRPLCVYPETAYYLGHGSTSVASNFACHR